MDLTKGEFSIPPGKIDHLFNLISLLLDDVSPTARDVSRITGTLISMELALGPVVRLRTRALYAVLNSVHSLSCKVALTREAVEELNFWRDNFFRLCGKPIWRPSPKIELLSYSDAGNVGWAGNIVQFGTHIVRGNWLGSEALCSSSFREVRAIRFVLQSFSCLLAGKECEHGSDNQSVCSILSVGSSEPHLQKEAVAIYNFAMKQVFAFLRSVHPATLISKLFIGRKLSTPMIGCQPCPFSPIGYSRNLVLQFSVCDLVDKHCTSCVENSSIQRFTFAQLILMA